MLKKGDERGKMGIKIKLNDGIKEYSKKKSGVEYFVDAETEKQLNFQVCEFACKDGSDYLKLDSALVLMLQRIRDHFNKPVIINSGYRNPEYNKKVGGASRSRHTYGRAADIAIKGVAPIEIARFVEKECSLLRGIGLYTWGVHVDTRAESTKWDSTSGTEKAVKTFLNEEKDTSKEDKNETNEFYTIKAGDTVWGICEKNKITIRRFRELNPTLINIALVYPGQKVRIK